MRPAAGADGEGRAAGRRGPARPAGDRVLAIQPIRPAFLAVGKQECQYAAPDGLSGVGGRRGTNRGWLALFRPPLPKRSVQRSSHCAFQRLKTHVVGNGTTVLALGITPTALFAHRRRLCPFPLWPALPAALVDRHPHEYYGHSVTIGLAPRRPSCMPSTRDVRARRRCRIRPLERGHSSPPAEWRVYAAAVLLRSPGGPASDVLRRGRVLATPGAAVRAVWPSP